MIQEEHGQMKKGHGQVSQGKEFFLTFVHSLGEGSSVGSTMGRTYKKANALLEPVSNYFRTFCRRNLFLSSSSQTVHSPVP